MGLFIPCGPPPSGTTDKDQATRKSEMIANKLSLYVYRANHDFSRPTNYRERKGGKIQEKKKITPNHTTHKNMPDGRGRCL